MLDHVAACLGLPIQKEGPGWSLYVELTPQWRCLLVSDMSHVMAKPPLPPKNSWFGYELYLGVKKMN